MGAQNTTLAADRVLKTSTSTWIRTLGCPERYSGVAPLFQIVDVNEDSHPWEPRTPFLERHRVFRMTTSTGTCALYTPERYSGAISHFRHVDVNVDSHPWVPRALFRCGILWKPTVRGRRGVACSGSGRSQSLSPLGAPTPLPAERTKSNRHTSFLSTHGLVTSLSRLSATIQGRPEYALQAPPALPAPRSPPARRSIQHAAGLVLGVRGHP